MTGILDTRCLVIGNSLNLPDLDRTWTPAGGESVIGKLGKPITSQYELVTTGVK